MIWIIYVLKSSNENLEVHWGINFPGPELCSEIRTLLLVLILMDSKLFIIF